MSTTTEDYQLATALKIFDRGDPQEAVKILKKVPLEPDTCGQIFTTLSRAYSELGKFDQAIETAQKLEGLPYGKDPARIIQAEILVANHREKDALEVLNSVSPQNVIANALKGILPHVIGGEDKVHFPISSSSLWFQSVLSVLFIYTERALEAQEGNIEALRTRSHLLLPDLRAESFRNPNPGPIKRAFEKLKSKSAQQRNARLRTVVQFFFDEDLEGAQKELQKWIRTEPDFFRKEGYDPRPEFLGGVLLTLGKHAEYLKWIKKADPLTGKDYQNLTSLKAFSLLATGKFKEAQRTLVVSDAVESAHLHAQIELAQGHRERALAWFRRAFNFDDIAHVDLALAELKYLGWTLSEN